MDEETKTTASAEAAEPLTERNPRSAQAARALIQKAKRASRRRFPTEDKIRIGLEGIRGEVSVVELCRREGIHPDDLLQVAEGLPGGRHSAPARRRAAGGDERGGADAAAGE